MSRTWVLISDAARARLFEVAEHDGMTEIACYSNPSRRSMTHNKADHSPSRTHDSHGPGRHIIEVHTSSREKSERQFASSIVEALEHGIAQHQCGRLILVAPPHFLGVLHAKLTPSLEKVMVGEIHNDLVSCSTQELADRLHEAFPRECHQQLRRAAL
ncbi:host attachment protein [Dyella koreensis]|uniref:Host attachment protein n=1 Tax=Dyella koreensis TaxID=311235 RepID=A0ABW8K9C4_9GAMM